MSRISRLLLVHANRTVRNGEGRLTYKPWLHIQNEQQEFDDWNYFMAWGYNDRKRLACRILWPFVRFVEKEVNAPRNADAHVDSEWDYLMREQLHSFYSAVTRALSLNADWWNELLKRDLE